MDEETDVLVSASLQFPTVVFTIALGIALVYWLFVLLGALDIDLLGGPDADVSGAAKGAGEAIGEAITGGAKAGGEAVKLDTDADGDGVWSGLGMRDVPMTISVSIVLLTSWCGSLLMMHYLAPAVGLDGASWFRALVVPGMLIVALPITALAVRPLVPIFRMKEGKSNTDYVGHTCTITTGHVDENFGQATVEDGGTVLVIAVRCDKPDKLARNDKALIIEFDPDRQAYVVEPAVDMLAETRAGSGDA